jgi:hypothetical protein
MFSLCGVMLCRCPLFSLAYRLTPSLPGGKGTKLVTLRIGHDRPLQFPFLITDLLQDTRAKALQTLHLRTIGHVNVDMHTILHNFGLRHTTEPDTQTTLWRQDGDRLVRCRLGRVYCIAKDFCPEMGNAVVIRTVEAYIAEARRGHGFSSLEASGGHSKQRGGMEDKIIARKDIFRIPFSLQRLGGCAPMAEEKIVNRWTECRKTQGVSELLKG